MRWMWKNRKHLCFLYLLHLFYPQYTCDCLILGTSDKALLSQLCQLVTLPGQPQFKMDIWSDLANALLFCFCFVSTISNRARWHKTQHRSTTKKSVASVLYNYWCSWKLPRAKHNLLFVMLYCLSSMHQASVFASHVPIPCLFIWCAFSFHVSPVNPSWKNSTSLIQQGDKENKFLQISVKPQVDYKRMWGKVSMGKQVEKASGSFNLTRVWGECQSFNRNVHL